MNTPADTKRLHEGPAPNEQEASSEQNTIVIENEALRKGFTVVPNYILSDTCVSFGARLTYMLLLSYAWKEGSCFPGQDKLAVDLGVTRKAVNKYLSELKDSKYVSWDRRGLGRTNIYYILNRQAITTPQKQAVNEEKEPCNNTYSDVTKRLHQNVTTGSHLEVTPRLHKQYTDEEYTEQQHVVVEELSKLQIRSHMVRELLTQYQPSYIQQKIDLLHWKQSSSRRGKDIKDSAAWLVKAIKEDYLPPPEFEKALARKQLKETKSLLAKELGQRIAVFDKEKNEQEKERQEDHIETLKSQYRTTKKERDLWQKALGVLATTTDKATYQLWLTHTTLLTLQDDVVTLYVTNNVVKQRIESHLATNISQAVNTVLGSSINYKVTAIT